MPVQIKTQCGCVGSVGDGAPAFPTISQTWNGNLKGSQWELGFDDASVCDTGIKVYKSVGGNIDDTTMLYANVQAATQSCKSGVDRRVVSHDRQDVSDAANVGDTATYCIKSSNQIDFDSANSCVDGVIQFAGRVSGFVKTSGGEATVNAKVWLHTPSWDGWEEYADAPNGYGFKDSIPSIASTDTSVTSTVPECKNKCINNTNCVAFERKQISASVFSCNFYGPWGSDFREGTSSTTRQFAGKKLENWMGWCFLQFQPNLFLFVFFSNPRNDRILLNRF